MTNRELIDFMHLCEKLKCAPRHSWTSSGRAESVAEHSWRLTVLAVMLCMEDEFSDIDFKKIVTMCLFHDIGEAVTGDIASFLKTKEHSAIEAKAVYDIINNLPSPHKENLEALFDEMEDMKSPEAKLYKSLDKIEAVIQHNEADISTWLTLEHKLNQTYGYEESAVHPRIRSLRDTLVSDTKQKLLDELNQ